MPDESEFIANPVQRISTLQEFIQQHRLMREQFEDTYSSIGIDTDYNYNVSFRVWSSHKEVWFNESSPESALEAYKNAMEGKVVEFDITLPEKDPDYTHDILTGPNTEL